MNPQKRFQLNQQALLLSVIAAAYPATGYCIAAGRTDFVVGEVVAVAADGSRRTLSKGSEINPGDAINTAAGARAQVRFADGGFISLQPETVFRIDEFNYQNKTDGQEKGFFSLLKGGLRAITGAIGHVNRNTYKVTTPVATIGIRGTGYNAVLAEGLQVSVGEGAILLSNNVGQIVVTSGGSAFVANISTPPATTTEQPQTPAASIKPITSTTVSQAEQTDSTGKSTLILPTLVSGSGYSMVFTGVDCDDGCSSITPTLRTNIVTTFSTTSQLLGYKSGTDGAEGVTLSGAATVAFSATNGTIGWGRWSGSTPSGTIWPHPIVDGVFDYVVGMPTASMPTSGTATYSLMGYTNPVVNDGSILTSGGSVSGTFAANFASGAVTMNMTVTNALSQTYALNGPLSNNISGPNFSGTLNGSGGGCATNCTTNISGLFVGANAVNAGLTYKISDSGNNNVTTGAAAFAK